MGVLADYKSRDQEYWFGKATRFAIKVPRPGELFPVYRATKGRYIRPGDYVTQSRKYAEEHLEAVLQGEGNIVTTMATIEDLTPVNPNEFWYVPKKIAEYKDLRDFWEAAKKQKGDLDKHMLKGDEKMSNSIEELHNVERMLSRLISDTATYNLDRQAVISQVISIRDSIRNRARALGYKGYF